MDYNFSIIGSNIKGLRRRKQLSQQDLADLINADQTTISRCERGKNEITWGSLERIAEALGTTVDNLTAGAEQMDYGHHLASELEKTQNGQVIGLLQEINNNLLKILNALDSTAKNGN